MDEQAYQQLLNAGRRLVETTEVEQVLARLADTARTVTGARYGALGVLDAERRKLARFLVAGIDDATVAALGERPRGHGVLGELIGDPRPLRLDDVAAHPRSYGFPPGHPPMSTFLGVPVMVGGEPFGNLYVTDKDGGFSDADEEALVVVAGWAAVAIRNAMLHDDLTDRRDELHRAVGTLEATTSIARTLAGETDLGRVLELIAKRGRKIVQARSLLIALVEGPDVVIAAVAGDAAAGLAGERLTGRSAEAVRQGRWPVRVGQGVPDPSLTQSLEAVSLGAETGLVVPLLFRHQRIGALVALDTIDDAGFDSDDERLLRAFAVSAAIAVGTAQSVGEEHRRRGIQAAEAERRRWARELHDDTLQELAAVRLRLARALRSDSPEAVRAAVAEAKTELDHRIAALRELIADVRPAALDQLGLVSALEGLAERMAGRDLQVELRVDDAELARQQPEVEEGLYRIAQEALTNALRHGAATHAHLELAARRGRIELTVRDDGRGFAAPGAANGFGLLGMRERTELLGGRLELRSQPGSGTCIHVSLPVQPLRASTVRAPDSPGLLA